MSGVDWTPPTEAVEAAARAWEPALFYSGYELETVESHGVQIAQARDRSRERARDAIASARPAILARVGEQIAQAIEAQPTEEHGREYAVATLKAAHIARTEAAR